MNKLVESGLPFLGFLFLVTLATGSLIALYDMTAEGNLTILALVTYSLTFVISTTGLIIVAVIGSRKLKLARNVQKNT